MMRRATTILAAAASLLACAPRNAATQAGDVAGCWYFERNAGADALNLPWGVRLTADALDENWPAMNGRDARHAATLTTGGDADHPFAYWLASAADSIEVGHPGGRGLVLDLHVSDTSLAGSARAVGDALPLDGPAARSAQAVRLTRARCPEG